MSPITTTQIATYEANVVSRSEPNQFAATVWLYRADHSVIAFLRFYRSGITMAANEFRSDLNTAVVSCRFDAYPPIVDVLRNEKPVYFTWFDYSPSGGSMFGVVGTSGLEPVGEQEGV